MVELDQNKVYLHVLYELRLLQKLELLKVFWKLDLILQGKSLIQKSNIWMFEIDQNFQNLFLTRQAKLMKN